MNTFLIILLAQLLIVIFFLVIPKSSIWNKLLSYNVSMTICMMFIVVLSLFYGSFLLDAAIIYALVGFVSTVFLARFYSKQDR